MRIGLGINYAGGFKEVAAEVADLERAGLDIVFVAEAYSFDAVSALGYLAASTERVAAGFGHPAAVHPNTHPDRDDCGGARLRFRRPVHPRPGRLRPAGHRGFPRRALRRPDRRAPAKSSRSAVRCGAVRRVQHQGKYYTIPLPAGRGTGLGKPLKLINQPVRERIPILVAALGPKNVELAAEIAEGWQPIFYLPEKARDVWGQAVDAGQARRDPALGPLDVMRRPGPGHRRKRRAAARIRQAAPGALHRRHGRQGQELLSHPGHPIRLRTASRPHPRALPVR